MEQYHNCFISMLETCSDEPEIPAAVLALVVTCVLFIFIYIFSYYSLFQIQLAIDDFSSGVCKKTEFNSDLYEDVYKSHGIS